MKKIFVLLIVSVFLVGCSFISMSSNFLPDSDKVIITNAEDGDILAIMETNRTKRVIIYPGGDVSFGILVWRNNYGSSTPVTVTIKEVSSGKVWSKNYSLSYYSKRHIRIIVRRGFAIEEVSGGY
jgi:uncharacterized lipoprotein YajG